MEKKHGSESDGHSRLSSTGTARGSSFGPVTHGHPSSKVYYVHDKHSTGDHNNSNSRGNKHTNRSESRVSSHAGRQPSGKESHTYRLKADRSSRHAADENDSSSVLRSSSAHQNANTQYMVNSVSKRIFHAPYSPNISITSSKNGERHIHSSSSQHGIKQENGSHSRESNRLSFERERFSADTNYQWSGSDRRSSRGSMEDSPGYDRSQNDAHQGGDRWPAEANAYCDVAPGQLLQNFSKERDRCHSISSASESSTLSSRQSRSNHFRNYSQRESSESSKYDSRQAQHLIDADASYCGHILSPVIHGDIESKLYELREEEALKKEEAIENVREMISPHQESERQNPDVKRPYQSRKFITGRGGFRNRSMLRSNTMFKKGKSWLRRALDPKRVLVPQDGDPDISLTQICSKGLANFLRKFVDSSFMFNSKLHMEALAAFTITNKRLEKEYMEKREEMRSQGYAKIQLQEELRYKMKNTIDGLELFVAEGLKVSNQADFFSKMQAPLEKNRSNGVFLYCNADTNIAWAQTWCKRYARNRSATDKPPVFFLLICKVVHGRVKRWPRIPSVPQLMSNLGCDCLKAIRNTSNELPFVRNNLLNSKVLIADFDKAGIATERPRQVLPFAVVVYTHRSTSHDDRQLMKREVIHWKRRQEASAWGVGRTELTAVHQSVAVMPSFVQSSMPHNPLPKQTYQGAIVAPKRKMPRAEIGLGSASPTKLAKWTDSRKPVPLMVDIGVQVKGQTIVSLQSKPHSICASTQTPELISDDLEHYDPAASAVATQQPSTTHEFFLTKLGAPRMYSSLSLRFQSYEGPTDNVVNEQPLVSGSTLACATAAHSASTVGVLAAATHTPASGANKLRERSARMAYVAPTIKGSQSMELNVSEMEVSSVQSVGNVIAPATFVESCTSPNHICDNSANNCLAQNTDKTDRYDPAFANPITYTAAIAEVEHLCGYETVVHHVTEAAPCIVSPIDDRAVSNGRHLNSVEEEGTRIKLTSTIDTASHRKYEQHTDFQYVQKIGELIYTEPMESCSGRPLNEISRLDAQEQTISQLPSTELYESSSQIKQSPSCSRVESRAVEECINDKVNLKHSLVTAPDVFVTDSRLSIQNQQTEELEKSVVAALVAEAPFSSCIDDKRLKLSSKQHSTVNVPIHVPLIGADNLPEPTRVTLNKNAPKVDAGQIPCELGVSQVEEIILASDSPERKQQIPVETDQQQLDGGSIVQVNIIEAQHDFQSSLLSNVLSESCSSVPLSVVSTCANDKQFIAAGDGPAEHKDPQKQLSASELCTSEMIKGTQFSYKTDCAPSMRQNPSSSSSETSKNTSCSTVPVDVIENLLDGSVEVTTEDFNNHEPVPTIDIIHDSRSTAKSTSLKEISKIHQTVTVTGMHGINSLLHDVDINTAGKSLLMALSQPSPLAARNSPKRPVPSSLARSADEAAQVAYSSSTMDSPVVSMPQTSAAANSNSVLTESANSSDKCKSTATLVPQLPFTESKHSALHKPMAVYNNGKTSAGPDQARQFQPLTAPGPLLSTPTATGCNGSIQQRPATARSLTNRPTQSQQWCSSMHKGLHAQFRQQLRPQFQDNGPTYQTRMPASYEHTSSSNGDHSQSWHENIAELFNHHRADFVAGGRFMSKEEVLWFLQQPQSQARVCLVDRMTRSKLSNAKIVHLLSCSTVPLGLHIIKYICGKLGVSRDEWNYYSRH